MRRPDCDLSAATDGNHARAARRLLSDTISSAAAVSKNHDIVPRDVTRAAGTSAPSRIWRTISRFPDPQTMKAT
jgi:hypothetical protein